MFAETFFINFTIFFNFFFISYKTWTEIWEDTVDRGYLSQFLFEDFCIFRVWFLGRLWYAKISSELLTTIEQYRISFERYTMVVNEQFMRRRHLWQPAPVTG